MSEELIKMSDAIEVIKKWFEKIKLNPDILIDSIISIPSADRPQGEWIRDMCWSRGAGMGEEYGFFYKCSLCEYEVENGYTRCDFNFCPYCGARMKGADDEYERAVEQMEYDMLYEPTYNPEDGSM